MAYLRVSTGTQDLANQKLAILEYARRKKFPINEFVEVQISSRKKPHQRGIDGMLERLAPGDRLIVSELSRLGRSLGQVIHIVDELVKRKIRFTAIKESIHFEGKQDLQTKVMVALFGLFAEVERDLISERTREGLASARAKRQSSFARNWRFKRTPPQSAHTQAHSLRSRLPHDASFRAATRSCPCLRERWARARRARRSCWNCDTRL